jgi:hypothetical protein
MAEGTILEHDLPDAGWYTDPENPRLQRYWAGTEWTQHVRHSDGVALNTQPTFVPNAQPAPTASHRAETEFTTVPEFAPQPSFTTQATMPSFEFSPSLTFSSPTVAESMLSLSASDRIAIEEPEQAAYIPLSTIHHSVGSSSNRWSARSSSPSTAPVWIIAVSPLLALASQFVALTIAPVNLTPIVSMAVGGGILLVLLTAAIMDAVTLRRRDLPSASPAWLFLTPLVFLGVRNFVLRREGFRYAAPLISFVLALVVSAVAGNYLSSIW